MKNFTQMITEAAAKDLHKPRRGSTVYLMKKEESKAYKVTITDVIMRKTNDPGVRYIDIKFSDNPLKVETLTNTHFVNNPEFYKDPKLVTLQSYEGIGTIYIGVTKEAIQEFINSDANTKLNGLIKKIRNAEKELDDLYKQRDELEYQANLEITESLH